jgi:hypothetical protein
LIVGYAFLLALLDLTVAMPGNPDFSSGWGAVGAVVVQLLVLWWLWRGSRWAWLIAVLMAVPTLPLILLMAPPAQVGVILLCAFSVAQAGILFTRPMRALILPRR